MVFINSGNVGKTLVSRNLLPPRLGVDCRRFAVESINHGVDGGKVYSPMGQYRPTGSLLTA